MTRTVLVVDDSKLARMVVKSILAKTRADWQIAEAANARRKLSTFSASKHVDIALIDFNMPDHDGLWLAAEITRRQYGHADRDPVGQRAGCDPCPRAGTGRGLSSKSRCRRKRWPLSCPGRRSSSGVPANDRRWRQRRWKQRRTPADRAGAGRPYGSHQHRRQQGRQEPEPHGQGSGASLRSPHRNHDPRPGRRMAVEAREQQSGRRRPGFSRLVLRSGAADLS